MARIDLRKLNCTVMSISNTTPNLRIQMQYVMEKNRLQNRHCFLTCPPFQFVARVRHSWLVASKFRNRSWWNSKEDLLPGVNQPKPTVLPGLLAFSSWQTLNAWGPGSGLWMVPALALARHALASMCAATYCGINNNSYDVQIRSAELQGHVTKVRKTSFLQPVYLILLDFFAVASSESPLFGRTPSASAGQNHTGTPPASQKHIKNQDTTC